MASSNSRTIESFAHIVFLQRTASRADTATSATHAIKYSLNQGISPTKNAQVMPAVRRDTMPKFRFTLSPIELIYELGQTCRDWFGLGACFLKNYLADTVQVFP